MQVSNLLLAKGAVSSAFVSLLKLEKYFLQPGDVSNVRVLFVEIGQSVFIIVVGLLLP